MSVPIKPVLNSCERIYENKIKLVCEDNTSKKDCYLETDLLKMYCTKKLKSDIHVKRVKNDIEIRGMRLCDTKGNSKINEYRTTTCVDRDINACLNIYKAGSVLIRPDYLIVKTKIKNKSVS